MDAIEVAVLTAKSGRLSDGWLFAFPLKRYPCSLHFWVLSFGPLDVAVRDADQMSRFLLFVIVEGDLGFD